MAAGSAGSLLLKSGISSTAAGPAWLVIGDYLHDHGIHKVLLPSYLCPSILDALERCGLEYGFYQVNEDLSIDLEDLAQKAGAFKAVYFINYFGFLHPPEVRNYLKCLRENGVLVVEDNAQAGFSGSLNRGLRFQQPAQTGAV